jgi:hypothetical protein
MFEDARLGCGVMHRLIGRSILVGKSSGRGRGGVLLWKRRFNIFL